MNLTEQVEEALEEEKTIAAEAPKTWNTSMEVQYLIYCFLLLLLQFIVALFAIYFG